MTGSLNKDNIKFLLLEGVSQKAVDALKNAGYNNIDYRKVALDGQELLDAIKDVHFIGIRSRTQLTAQVLEHAEQLLAIGCFCIGTNQVDLKAALAKGIPVFNAPFSNTRSVAELALGEIILLMRNAVANNAQLHLGVWNKSASNSNEVRGKTLGIIGYGHIGSQLSILAEAIGINVIFYDVEAKLPLGNATQVKTLEELLSQSDIISLHVPAIASTKNLINLDNIAHIKQGAVLLNLARGEVLQQEAIVKLLETKQIRGAGLDVFAYEPSSNKEEFVNPLRNFDNVFLTPHIGGSTSEAQENIGTEVALKFIKYADNGSTLSSVNFPEVSLPNHNESARLLHIHRNEPGVLNKIIKIFSEQEINIAGQFLSTNPDIGYVVIDVNTDTTKLSTLVDALWQIPATIKVRLLK